MKNKKRDKLPWWIFPIWMFSSMISFVVLTQDVGFIKVIPLMFVWAILTMVVLVNVEDERHDS